MIAKNTNSKNALMKLDEEYKDFLKHREECDDQFFYYHRMRDAAGREDRIEQGAIERGLKQGIKQGMQQGMQQGLEQGEQKKAEEFARKLLKKKMDVDEIIELTGLSAEHIKKLKE